MELSMVNRRDRYTNYRDLNLFINSISFIFNRQFDLDLSVLFGNGSYYVHKLSHMILKALKLYVYNYKR